MEDNRCPVIGRKTVCLDARKDFWVLADTNNNKEIDKLNFSDEEKEESIESEEENVNKTNNQSDGCCVHVYPCYK